MVDLGAGLVRAGGVVSLIVQVKEVLPLTPSCVALIVTEYGELFAARGSVVPEIRPELGLIVRPVGKVWTPLTRSVYDPGSTLVEPAAVVIWSDTAWPSLLFCIPGLLNVGGAMRSPSTGTWCCP